MSAAAVEAISGYSTDPGLPEGWVNAPVESLFDVNPRKVIPDDLEPGSLITFVPMSAVDAERGTIATPEIRPLAEVAKGYTAFREGDVIVAKITPCFENGKAAIARDLVNGVGFGSTEFHVLRPTGVVVAEYVYHFVRQERFREGAAGEMTGTVGQKRLPADFLREVVLPVAPLAEQRRIVAAVEALLQRVNAARERLAKVPAILKRCRQAVLAAACSGRLTEEWREAHPLAPSESLLVRLRRKANAAGKVALTDAVSDAPSLPESWMWAPLGWLGLDSDNAVQTGPFGALLHRDEFVSEGVPVVAVGNLTGMGFTKDGLYFIRREKAQDLKRFDVQAGDVLFARSGATLGKVCVAPDFVRDWRMTGHILRARLDTSLVCPDMVTFALRGAPYVVEQVNGRVRGVTRPGYNTQLLESVLVPVPPLAEQQAIVHRVKDLFALADEIERRVAVAMSRAERVTQTILAEAFRGELVPSEAELVRREGREYEPAGVLLERIRRERAVQHAKGNQLHARTGRSRARRTS